MSSLQSMQRMGLCCSPAQADAPSSTLRVSHQRAPHHHGIYSLLVLIDGCFNLLQCPKPRKNTGGMAAQGACLTPVALCRRYNSPSCNLCLSKSFLHCLQRRIIFKPVPLRQFSPALSHRVVSGKCTQPLRNGDGAGNEACATGFWTGETRSSHIPRIHSVNTPNNTTRKLRPRQL